MKRNKSSIILRGYFRILSWTIKPYFPSVITECQSTVTRSARIIEQILARRGLVALVSYLKSRRTALMLYLAGDPRGYLTHLLSSSLRRQIRNGNREAFRFALSLLFLSRGFRATGIPDLSNITSPSEVDTSVEDEIIRFVKESEVKHLQLKTRDEGHHFSMKAGPKGPALLTAVADARTLTETQLHDIQVLGSPGIYHSIMRYREPRSHPEFWDWAAKLGLKDKRADWTRAIAIRSDRELKLRPFAILDFWSQEAMFDLHTALFKRLRTLETDFTFDQQRGKEYLTKIVPNSCYHSLDLTAATDRFPVSLQEKFLAYLLDSEEKAAAWRRLMVGTPFHIIGTSEEASYNTGQPMGAYSSWATFSYTHHMVVKYAARDINYSRYALLGDDIVIADDHVALEYRKIMTSLGVEINMSKTLVSPNTFEFAKRLIHKGLEYSCFPILSVLASYKVPTLLALTLRLEVESRDLRPSLGYTMDLAINLYNRFHYRLGKIRSQARHWYLAQAFPVKGVRYDQESSALSFFKHAGVSMSCNLTETSARTLLLMHIAEVVKDSLSESYRKAVRQFNEWYLGEAFSLPGWEGERPPKGVLYSLPVIEANQLQTDTSYDDYMSFAQKLTSEEISDIEEGLLSRVVTGLGDPALLVQGNRRRLLIGVQSRIIQQVGIRLRDYQADRTRELANSELSEWDKWLLSQSEK